MSTTVNVGKSINVEIDFATMPQAALNHILYIGARNILMDSHASITADEYPEANARQEAASAMVQKKLDALMRGEVRVQSTREGDPVRAEAKRMATAQIAAKLKKDGRKIADVERAKLNEAIDKLLTPELMAEAKARVAKLQAITSDDTSLMDLGL